MQNFLVAVVVVLLAGGGYFWYTAQEAAAPEISAPPINTAPANAGDNAPNSPAGTPAPANTTGAMNISVEANSGASVGAEAHGTGASASGSVSLKEITVTSTGTAFNQKTLSVKKGDRVRITYQNGGGTHDLKIDGYNVGTKVISGGASETFEFVASEAGTFEYYCSVGNHRAMGMKGTLTVTN
jgi:plastocyanin